MNPDRIIVVLAEPENPKNIGLVARAMRCNEVTQLRIVSQNMRTIHEDAYITCTHGKEILRDATFFSSLQEAIADAHQSVAFSRRDYDITDSWVNMQDIETVLDPNATVALVFGRESVGLSREEIGICSRACTIPVSDRMSFNLGQAAAIALYQMSTIKKKKFNDSTSELPASLGAKQAFVDYVNSCISDEYKTRYKEKFAFTNWMERLNPSDKDLNFIFGALRDIVKTAKKQ
jgi:tRNA (cytidine32/uridine32-2'-O)-methyltransferase